jgi:HlyD family secretion protein
LKRKWKIAVLIGLFVVIAGGVLASIKISQRGIVVVQTGKAVREDLTSLVTASGEIKPKNYINIGANQQGPIAQLFVKEGDHVKKGQLLARIQAEDASADVRAQQALLRSTMDSSAAAEAGVKAQEDLVKALQADLEKDKADEAQKLADYNRATQLYKEQLLARQDYDAKKAAYDGAVAAVQGAQSRLAQARAQRAQNSAQLSSTQATISQQEAMMQRYRVLFDKYNAYAPLDGVVTNLPVRVG